MIGFDADKVKRYVEAAMVLKRIDKHILSARVDMPIRTLNEKLSTGNWKISELVTVFNYLSVTDEQLLDVFGRRSKR